MGRLIVAVLAVSVFIGGCDNKTETPAQKEEKTVKKVETASLHTEETRTEVSKNVETTTSEEKASAEETVKQKEEEKESEEKGEELNGEAIFKAKGCASCHQPAVDTVGPSLKKIAQSYQSDKEKLIHFLKGNGEAIVDPSKFGIMKPQLEITKKMSDDQLEAMAEYILKH